MSYNRAYRSPSVINNHLDLVIAQPIDIRGLAAAIGLPPTAVPNPYLLPINIKGNPDLKEQSLDSFEIGYSSIVKRAVISAAYYHNWVKNEILFTEDVTGRYTRDESAGQLAAAPALIAFDSGREPAGSIHLLELRQEHAAGDSSSASTPRSTSSWTCSRITRGRGNRIRRTSPLTELNLPADQPLQRWRWLNYNRYMANLSVSYSDSAFWQDVLGAEYAGTTEAYTLVNAGFGVKWMGDRLTTSIKAVNLGNDDVQQHAFGDLIGRRSSASCGSISQVSVVRSVQICESRRRNRPFTRPTLDDPYDPPPGARHRRDAARQHRRPS